MIGDDHVKKMVGIIGAAALTSALFVGVPAGAFASEPAGSGIESCSGQWSEVSVSDSASPAYEAFPNEGGTWQYGANPVKMWSNYWHASKCHGSSVYTNTNKSVSIDTAAGQWSYAQLWVYDSSARYYYRIC